MEITANVTIDWLEGEGDDYKINDLIQKKIINQIVKQIYSKIFVSLEKKALKKTEKVLDKYVLDFIKKRMKKKVVAGDGWDGNETTMDKLFKKKIDKALERKVDHNGKEDRYGSYTRFEFITGAVIDKKLNDLVRKMSIDIDSKIKEIFTDQIKKQIEDNFVNNIMKNINISKMIGMK